MNSLCPICEREILTEDRYRMIALEFPYKNIKFHFECYNQNKENMLEILHKTTDLWYNINYNEKISSKKKGKQNVIS